MTNSVSRFDTTKPTKVELNGQEITVYHQLFVSNKDNDLLVKHTQNCYKKSGQHVKYGIGVWVEKAIDKLGASVFKLPENFKGTISEYDEGELEIIGTLMKKGNKWYVETNLETVELIKRDIAFYMMESKTLRIGRFGNDVEAYKAHLAKLDAENGKLKVSGHGFSGKNYLSMIKTDHGRLTKNLKMYVTDHVNYFGTFPLDFEYKDKVYSYDSYLKFLDNSFTREMNEIISK